MQEIFYLFVLLLLSAFFSSAEIALISLPDFRIRYLLEQGLRGAKSLAIIRQNKQRLLITVLIGNNIVNIAASALATKVAILHFPSVGVGLAVGVMTFLVLTFGEIMPKAFATAHATRMALAIAPIFRVLVVISLPLVKMFNFITIIVQKTVGSRRSPRITEKEISILVEYGQEEGAIKDATNEMIQNIFKFDDIDVKEVMTPRTDFVIIQADKSLHEALAIIAEHGYSRIPVYKDKIDHVIGILYVKDIISTILEEKLDITVETIAKPPYFVPETMSVEALFWQLKRRNIHIAIVVDEYGGIAGLVTLEDLLEQIVGDIFDETDKIDPHIQQLDHNTWLVKGKTDVDDLNKELDFTIEENGDYETISGYILHLAKKIPVANETFEDEHAFYTIVKTTKNRISTIKIAKKN